MSTRRYEGLGAFRLEPDWRDREDGSGMSGGSFRSCGGGEVTG